MSTRPVLAIKNIGSLRSSRVNETGGETVAFSIRAFNPDLLISEGLRVVCRVGETHNITGIVTGSNQPKDASRSFCIDSIGDGKADVIIKRGDAEAKNRVKTGVSYTIDPVVDGPNRDYTHLTVCGSTSEREESMRDLPMVKVTVTMGEQEKLNVVVPVELHVPYELSFGGLSVPIVVTDFNEGDGFLSFSYMPPGQSISIGISGYKTHVVCEDKDVKIAVGFGGVGRPMTEPIVRGPLQEQYGNSVLEMK